ncbi:hypothetical protein AM587_10011542 [Phytophthora nicotianae]|uniref:RxLR effector protein n=1 Tax=Phytophthora nicotianae TaxID=4792 RepID=A0A0W8D4M2_PHYNI|nr:hypothetical protein AM587_10011542 [Phytophthora nicotianae]KUF91345.1 hypothetical protein AM588_10008224 [Phytophthora nicotianae]
MCVCTIVLTVAAAASILGNVECVSTTGAVDIDALATTITTGLHTPTVAGQSGSGVQRRLRKHEAAHGDYDLDQDSSNEERGGGDVMAKAVGFLFKIFDDMDNTAIKGEADDIIGMMVMEKKWGKDDKIDGIIKKVTNGKTVEDAAAAER